LLVLLGLGRVLNLFIAGTRPLPMISSTASAVVALAARKIGQDVVGGIVAGRRPSDAETDAQEIRRELADQRLEPVVAAGAAPGPQLEAAERQIQVVVDDDRPIHRDLPELGHHGRRLAAEIHELHGFT
jgi:hypothetical protein